MTGFLIGFAAGFTATYLTLNWLQDRALYRATAGYADHRLGEFERYSAKTPTNVRLLIDTDHHPVGVCTAYYCHECRGAEVDD